MHDEVSVTCFKHIVSVIGHLNKVCKLHLSPVAHDALYRQEFRYGCTDEEICIILNSVLQEE